VPVQRHFQAQRVTGHDRFFEPSIVDPDEVVDQALVGPMLFTVKRQDRAGLRHRLDDQHPRHHRVMREMALEVRLVDRDILESSQMLARLAGEHPVDHQERVAVRQILENLADVHAAHGLLLLARFDGFSSSRTRCASSARCRSWAAFLSHSRCGSNA
jgi:hypothetical protein